MKCKNSNCTTVKINVSKEERERAKSIAKSRGMTFQGFLGQLIKNELKRSEAESDGNRN